MSYCKKHINWRLVVWEFSKHFSCMLCGKVLSGRKVEELLKGR